MTVPKTMAVVALALVLAAVPCSGQAVKTFLASEMMEGCECTGDNSALGVVELAKHGPGYGKWCAAWDDGKCTPGATAEHKGAHSCNGTMMTCPQHWPEKDFAKDQSWCCDSWCYVNITTCTKEKQELYGITVAKSWTGKGIWYSYGVCPDPWTQPSFWQALPDGMKTIKSYSQYEATTCPYYKAPPAATPAPAGYAFPKPTDKRTHVVKLAVELPVKKDDFDSVMQTKYKLSIATAAGGGVTIYDIDFEINKDTTTASRRLLESHSAAGGALRLDTMVKVAGGEFAGRVKSLLTKDAINAALKANGLPAATILEQPTSMTVGDAAASTAASMLVSRWFGVVTLVSVAISSALF